MKNVHMALFVAFIFGLAGCGGGSAGGDSTPVTTPASTGVLTDSAVGGVSYTTSGGYSGVTDANGRYKFNPGETVTFKIGAITLGTATAAEALTPIQLAGNGVAATNRVVNLLVLLQSLDSDGNPGNGISINAATIAAASAAGALDFSQDPAVFGANATLITLMTASGLVGITLGDTGYACSSERPFQGRVLQSAQRYVELQRWHQKHYVRIRRHGELHSYRNRTGRRRRNVRNRDRRARLGS